MNDAKRHAFCILFLTLGNATHAQTLNNNNVVVFTNLTDNLSGSYNAGIEYILPIRKNIKDNVKTSISLNGSLISTNPSQNKIKGASINLQTNLYTDIVLTEKWNEFGGIKLSYSAIENTTERIKYQSYFIGISTGIQPVIAKFMTIRVSSEIGYIHNGLTNTILFVDKNMLLYSGFVINAKFGIGIRI